MVDLGLEQMKGEIGDGGVRYAGRGWMLKGSLARTTFFYLGTSDKYKYNTRHIDTLKKTLKDTQRHTKYTKINM